MRSAHGHNKPHIFLVLEEEIFENKTNQNLGILRAQGDWKINKQRPKVEEMSHEEESILLNYYCLICCYYLLNLQWLLNGSGEFSRLRCTFYRNTAMNLLRRESLVTLTLRFSIIAHNHIEWMYKIGGLIIGIWETKLMA